MYMFLTWADSLSHRCPAPVRLNRTGCFEGIACVSHQPQSQQRLLPIQQQVACHPLLCVCTRMSFRGGGGGSGNIFGWDVGSPASDLAGGAAGGSEGDDGLERSASSDVLESPGGYSGKVAKLCPMQIRAKQSDSLCTCLCVCLQLLDCT